NPFFQVSGFEGTARFTSPSLSRYELSRPFPEFGAITMFDRNDGSIWYNSAQLAVNKRVSTGLSLAGTYTLSKMIEQNGGDNVHFDAQVIPAVRPCVAQMSDAGVVTMLSYSVAAGCIEPNFIIKPNYTGAFVNFRDNAIRRPPFYQFDINFAKTTKLAGNARLQIRFELYNVLNQTIYDERQYENNPTNSLFGTIDRTQVRQSNFPRYGQLGIKLLF